MDRARSLVVDSTASETKTQQIVCDSSSSVSPVQGASTHAAMRTARETPIVYGLDGYWERMLGGYTPGSAVDKQVQRQDGAHVAARAMDAAKELREVKLVLGLEGPDKHVADAMRRSLMSSSARRRWDILFASVYLV